jgi:hypothetical protein
VAIPAEDSHHVMEVVEVATNLIGREEDKNAARTRWEEANGRRMVLRLDVAVG